MIKSVMSAESGIKVPESYILERRRGCGVVVLTSLAGAVVH